VSKASKKLRREAVSAKKFRASDLSILALGATLLAPYAIAADADQDAAANTKPATKADEDLTEILVTGIRKALQTSQDIKRNADTVVDSITATDIGSFPDKSVAEALQRVAGITVNRFAATGDTAHFSAEPSGVIVRGLPQVRSEFNGRDSFSANSSRGLGWGDVSPELMSGVDTYKNQTAELIEGGIAGSINLRTRLPFDSEGTLFALSGDVSYGDLAAEYSPSVSGIWSSRWDLGSAGELGVMANVAYSEISTNSEGIQYGRMGVFENVFQPNGLNYIPTSVSMRDNLYSRTRKGASAAAQWQDPSHALIATLQFNHSGYQNDWEEYVASGSAFGLYAQPGNYRITSSTVVQPAVQPGPDGVLGTADDQASTFTFDSQGNFESGMMTSDIGWWGANNTESANVAHNAAGQNLVNACYGWNGCNPAQRGADLYTDTRFNTSENITDDVSLNVKWNASERLLFNFDIQKVKATVSNYDISVGQSTYGNFSLDASGSKPTIAFTTPNNLNLSSGGPTNPNNYRYQYVMDHTEDSDGDELAVRLDGQFMMESDWMNSLKMGVRHADREQTVRWGNYNWANIANTWCQNGSYYNIDNHTGGAIPAGGDCNGSSTQWNGYPTGLYLNRPFDSEFFGGGRVTPNEFVFADINALKNRDTIAGLSRGELGVGNWNPICSGQGNRSDEVDGCYKQQEILDVSEVTNAAYLMLKFGGDQAAWGNVKVSGNIGVRYVKTQIESTGALVYPTISLSQRVCTAQPPPQPGQPAPVIAVTIGCFITPDMLAFASGGSEVATSFGSTAKQDTNTVLPSFNLKLDLTEKFVLRFGASRAMARPDMGYLKNFTSIGITYPSTTDATDPRWIKDSSGVIVGMNPTYTASSQNPFLEPTTADQYDLTLENYFSDVGSLSLALFYKKFNNYIQYGSYNRDLSLNGSTHTVEVKGPIQGDGAKISGAEVAFQRYFDFFRAPFDGLGMQANYTYVKNTGIKNQNTTIVSGDGSGGTSGGGISQAQSIQTDSLEGLSKNAYNLIGMYEKGSWAARVAYSWRSKYLVTALDCCVALPVWQDAAGFLDASLRYRINDNLELNIQGSNLLNTKTVLLQQVDDGGLLKDYSWFQNDRRIQFGIRFKM
jgi:iron complex outermembrane receptor protein